jgi:hypothetical protein
MTRGRDQHGVIVDRRVTHILEMDGRFVLVENAPACVNLDTGEQPLAPETVERLQRMIRGGEQPVRVIETPSINSPGSCAQPTRGHPRPRSLA